MNPFEHSLISLAQNILLDWACNKACKGEARSGSWKLPPRPLGADLRSQPCSGMGPEGNQKDGNPQAPEKQIITSTKTGPRADVAMPAAGRQINGWTQLIVTSWPSPCQESCYLSRCDN